jgi:NO-binding membrane sensor protein with MHYT domain
VEECDFDRQFLFDEYVAISHRYDLKKVSLKNEITVLSSYVKIELFSKVDDARQPVEFP